MANRALLIGINEYEYVGSLAGCLNDVELFGGVLTDNYGFEDSNITRVVDPENRRADILDAFDSFVADTSSDDAVVIYYSGHGSQSADRDGDEPDDMDETICPSDTGRGAEDNTDITDDEINSVVQALTGKGADVTFIFDSCHSGSATRAALRQRPPGATVRWIVPDRRAPKGEPHLQPQTDSKAKGDRADGGWVPTGRHVFVSGCKAEELSNEYNIGGRRQGALTYHLCEQLTNGATSWQEAVEAAAAKVSEVFPEQHPQLEAPEDRRDDPPFGG